MDAGVTMGWGPLQTQPRRMGLAPLSFEDAAPSSLPLVPVFGWEEDRASGCLLCVHMGPQNSKCAFKNEQAVHGNNAYDFIWEGRR